MLLAVQQIFDPGSRRARPKEDRVVKSVMMKSILVCGAVIIVAGLASAQTFTHFNPPPCDFSDQFYADNGIVSAATNPAVSNPELDTEPDGRFGTFRKTGPPATGSQVNWVPDTTDCSATDPDRRNFRILATTAGNADDGNSPFSCQDVFNGQSTAVPQCPPPNGSGTQPESLEFISILAFLHAQGAFETTDSRTVGAITNGGLDGVQQNDGEKILITNGANPRGIHMIDIVGAFEAYGAIDQFKQSVTCTDTSNPDPVNCTPSTQVALNPCSLGMIRNQQNPNAHSVPMPCFRVGDTKDANNNTISDVATPNLRQNWRFATNRNAMDGSDGNCINNMNGACSKIADQPFGYFCDDLLGMWIVTYFWFSAPPNDAKCGPIYQKIGKLNGFAAHGYPIIMTAHELNDEIEGTGCGNEAQQDPSGIDKGAAWLVCPAIPDPRNGAIASDAFLDVVTHGSSLDTFISNNFTCLQTTGKFCGE